MRRQRKVREGIESLRHKYNGSSVLHNYKHMTIWQPVLNMYSGKKKEQKIKTALLHAEIVDLNYA